MFFLVITGIMLFLLMSARSPHEQHMLKMAFAKGFFIPLILLILLVVLAEHKYPPTSFPSRPIALNTDKFGIIHISHIYPGIPDGDFGGQHYDAATQLGVDANQR